MTFYSASIIVTELLMISMTLHVINYKGFTKEEKKWYLLTFFTIMFCAAAEFFVHYGYYNPKFKVFLTVITVLQFSASPMLGVLFAGALGMHNSGRTATFVYLFNLTLEVLFAPFGYIFYFNETGYFRGEYFFIYEILYILSLLFLIINMVIVGRRFKHKDFFTIVMIIVILFAGVIPMTIYRINITYMAIAIDSVLCYIYYNDLIKYQNKEELLDNQKKISAMQEHIISGMASLIEDRDMDTGEHITRTSAYCKILAERAKEGVYTDVINDDFITKLSTLAPLHDVGKITVSDTILRKPARLTKDEYEEMKKHAKAGGDIVKDVLNGISDEDYIDFASNIALYHHEWWDGTGYPYGLKGDEIPLEARIMAISDVYDALVSKRIYKEPIPYEEACQLIESESGTHFDPKLVEVFTKYKSEFYTK